jgi:sigma-B regulation protein RsbU (phosphoserine phosphatase)
VTLTPPPTSFDARRSGVQPRPVLVVDDSKAQRRILQMQLTRWGYDVTEAGSGEEALALCQTRHFDIILSDWMMTGMSGLEFCKAFRELPREAYGYFVMLTSKSEKTEIADGLEHGADDFVSKPVNADELRARLRSGTRILGMQDELVEKNRLISSTLGKLQTMYDSLDRDLIEARKLQQTLVRDRFRDFGAGSAALMLRPSGHVGGDLVGSFVIDDDRVVVYAVDVSGHGVASAMMTARLAGLLSGGSADQNIALKTGPDGRKDAWRPAEVAERLNRMMLEDIQVDQYFTLAYAEINLRTGATSLVQAGHPHPILLHKNGRIEELGAGGMPIGLVTEATFQQIEFSLRPGDRLFLVSDGVTECPNPEGEELGAQGMIALLRQNLPLKSPQLLEALLWDLNSYAGGKDLPDDVSGLIFDYRGET